MKEDSKVDYKGWKSGEIKVKLDKKVDKRLEKKH